MSGRTRLLCIYASQDDSLRQTLESHLTSIVKEGLIEGRHVGQILAGSHVSDELAAEVSQAGIVLLLLSSDFMASAACWSLLAQAREQCATRRLLVVPVLARPVDWRATGLEDWQPLPRNGQPVTLWPNQDAAWVDVVDSLRALLTGASMSRSSKEIIDFAGERMRHESFWGREDVLAQLDQWLLCGRRRGFVLVTGGPGMGKSAILNEWLRRRKQAGELIPHHFMRRGQRDWDQPGAVTRNLAAQIELLFPAQRDAQAQPERRLDDLLLRVSREVLVPGMRRLILVIDGMDEAAASAGDNPLPLFLPWSLPPGVLVLCASRPTYPNLGWLKARDGGVPTVDLDDKPWSGSNAEACRRFWQAQAFMPPLPTSVIEQALDRGRGNLLYAVKLRDQLELLSAEERQVLALPAGLEGWLDESWQRFVADAACWPLLQRGLGLLCAAREALPVSALDALLGGVHLREALLRRVRSVLLEEPAAWRHVEEEEGEVAYRLHHESFRGFLEKKLGGAAAMQGFHQTLVETLAPWPAAAEPFHRGYVLRHGVVQRVEAGRWQEVRALCVEAGYLEAKIELVGLEATERDVEQAAQRCPDARLRKELYEIARALRAESHWLRVAPHELAAVLYNRLLTAGWPENLLKPLSGPALQVRLRHPLQRRDTSERTLVGHSNTVCACAVSADGKRAISGSWDQTLKVWDLDSGREQFTLSGHSDRVRACALSTDGKRAISGSNDQTLRVWDLDSGHELFTLSGHSNRVTTCAVSADGKRAISGSQDQTLKVWDLDSGRELFALSGHSEEVRACALSADGKRAISGSNDQTLKVWDLDTRRELFTLSGHSDEVRACAVSADGKRAVSGSSDQTLKVWDLDSGHELFTLSGHSGVVFACAVSADGKCAVAASGSVGQRLWVWDLDSGCEQLLTLSGHSNGVMACALSADGKRALSGSHDTTLKVWDLDSGRALFSLSGHSNWVRACAVSADGKRAVSGSQDQTLKVWDPDSGRELFTLSGHSGVVFACAVSADGKRAVSGSGDQTLKVWDLDTRRELFTLSGHSKPILACAVSADGKRAVSSSTDETLKVWDLDSGRELFTLSGHAGSVACAVSADGRRAVSTSGGQMLKVWDLDNGRELFTLSGHSDTVLACALSADGKRAVSGSYDGMLKVWDLDSVRELLTLSGHSKPILACAVSADGKRAVSCSNDQTLQMWDLDSGTCLGKVYGTAMFLCLALRGSLLVAGDAAGNVWMLELDESLGFSTVKNQAGP